MVYNRMESERIGRAAFVASSAEHKAEYYVVSHSGDDYSL